MCLRVVVWLCACVYVYACLSVRLLSGREFVCAWLFGCLCGYVFVSNACMAVRVRVRVCGCVCLVYMGRCVFVRLS